MTKNVLFFVTFWLLAVCAAQAQPMSLVMPTKKVSRHSVFDVPIRATGFNIIQSLQFTMKWNSSVISLVNINSPSDSLLGLGLGDSFGYIDTINGTLTFNWYNVRRGGFNIPDTATLFKLRFYAKGSPDAVSNMLFSNIPTFVEVSDSNSSVFTPTIINGIIVIKGPVATEEISDDHTDFELLNVFPNPIGSDQKTVIQLKAFKNTDLNWSLFDVNGKLLAHSIQKLETGVLNTIELDYLQKKNIPSGEYYLQIKTERQLKTLPLTRL